MMHLAKQFDHLKVQLEAIKSATNNFADENCIGRGGFGKVYKGELLHSMGQTTVALKRLDPRFGQGNPEFWKEIIMLSLYKHENIVSLLGFCDEGNEKIIMYEYASRRSLDLYLNKDDLTWIHRLKICIGAARGLAYLHNPGGTQHRALHRDVKSSNILLDEYWNAKISDLGLSKLGPANQQYTYLISNTVGTIGYIDPLYIETGLLTKESDVYSFGVVLFEVLCGRLCTSNKNGIHQSLTGLVRRYYKENKINEIVFGNIKDEIHPKSLEEFTSIAYRCLKRDLQNRPLMTDVVSVLEKALQFQVSYVFPLRSFEGGEGQPHKERGNLTMDVEDLDSPWSDGVLKESIGAGSFGDVHRADGNGSSRMPTPVTTARQCLAPEAVQVLDKAVSVAHRRFHAQTLALHAVSVLLSLPFSPLREACALAGNIALKALELCVGVSLDRLPSTPQQVEEPPISNSFMAAIKRSQAIQQRQPSSASISMAKVELRNLILSILDDPVVSRVFGESGFQISEIKSSVKGLNRINVDYLVTIRWIKNIYN